MYHPGALQAVTRQVALIRGAAWTLQMLPLVPSSRPSSLGTAEAGGGEGFSDRQAAQVVKCTRLLFCVFVHTV